MIIQLNGLYLDRVGHKVGIVRDRGAREVWRWVTTLDYYVMVDGRATLAGGESSQDLVVDITPSASQVAGMDSTMGALS